MKKLIMITVMLFTMNTFAQDAITMNPIDSVQIFYPDTMVKLKTVKDGRRYSKVVDSLNNIYRTDVFVVIYYFRNPNRKPLKTILRKRSEEIKQEITR